MSTTIRWEMPKLEALEALYAPALANKIYYSTADKNEIIYNNLFRQLVQEYVPPGIILHLDMPKDLNNFVDIMECIFSKNALNQIRMNHEEFKVMVGDDDDLRDYIDTFLSRETFWTILQRANEALFAQSNKCVPSVPIKLSSARRREGHAYSKSMSARIPQYDGAGDKDEMVVQIELEGTSILDAWQKQKEDNPLFRSLLTRDTAPSSVIKQGSSGGYRIFHGTDAHLCEGDAQNWPLVWITKPLNMQPSTAMDQSSPQGVGVVYTAFNMLRCYVWAAYKADMFKNIPDDNTKSKLQKSWTFQPPGGQNFNGLAVFVYNSVQPAPSACTHYTLPAEKSTAFSEEVYRMSRPNQGSEIGTNHWDANKAWRHLKPIHGAELDMWPDVLHTNEHGYQSTMLGSELNIKNLWRTCWAGRGVASLGKSYAFTLAISLKIVAKPLPAPKINLPLQQVRSKDDDDRKEDKDPKNAKGKENQAKEKGGVHKLKRNVSKFFKK